MNLDQLLQKIIEGYTEKLSGSSVLAEVTKHIELNKATYADAYALAREVGESLTTILREKLPTVLIDGKLPKNIAQMLIKPSMLKAGEDVTRTTSSIQKQLNERANIGLKAVEPDQNIDQIDGIIDGIVGGENYESRLETTMDGIENYFEGHVDDFVHDNAEFHYKAGMSPKIERKSSGKCCEWCSKLVGTYEYREVMNTGNDVFRRHKNCHCQVLYNPSDGSKRKQNVYTKAWS